MPVPSSGVLKLSDIALEFQDTVPYRLSKYYRGGALVPNSSQNANVPTSGAIGLRNFYGAVRRVVASQTYSTNTTQTTLNVSTLSGYVAGITDITITVNPGIYVYSTSTATPALTITGATAGDTILLVNNGFILGMGGAGAGLVGGQPESFNGNPGGPALSINRNVTITNNSYIAGGGGGGASGDGNFTGGCGGGGAGGGNGGTGVNGTAPGGAGGGPGVAGGNGGVNSISTSGGGGGGGRILPGVGGAARSPTGQFNASGGFGGGAGGAGGDTWNDQFGVGARGGAGGSANLAGSNPTENGFRGGGAGGGGWGAVGGNSQGTFPLNSSTRVTRTGGAGGRAIALNGFTVTYITIGTLYGAVS